MSTFEQIFLDPGSLSIERAASKLAKAIRFTVREFEGLLTLSATASEADIPADISGTLEPNVYAEKSPEEVTIFSSLPLVFEFRTSEEETDRQAETAHLLYARTVEKLQWPSVLTSGYTELIAVFDRERGLRTFGPGTRSDGTHEHLWG